MRRKPIILIKFTASRSKAELKRADRFLACEFESRQGYLCCLDLASFKIRSISTACSMLDLVFCKDVWRVRRESAGENLAVIRQIALNFLRNENIFKASIKHKKKSGM